MAENDLDRELRRRLGELRSTDDAKTPGFAAVLARVRRPRASRHGRRLRLVLGAAAAAIAIFFFVRPSREHEGVPATSAASSIAEWKSPTRSLLETPGDELYGEPPPAAEPLPRWILQLEPPSPGASAPSTPARKGATS